MKQPLIDLKEQYRSISGEIDSALRNVIERTDFVFGKCQKHKKNWQKNKPRLTSRENLDKQRENRKEKFFQYRALNFRHHYDAREIPTMELLDFLQ